MMRKSKRVLCLVLSAVFVFSSLMLGGCNKNPEETDASTVNTVQITETTMPETSETKGKIDPDKADGQLGEVIDYKEEALKIAAEVGLSEEDLKGEYALFLEYAEAVSGNPSLYQFSGYVYQLFPVVADNLDEEDKEHFLDKVKTLRFEEDAFDSLGGYYSSGGNYVLIGDAFYSQLDGTFAFSIYHELMHFVDGSIDEGGSLAAYMNDGTIKDASELTEEEKNDVKQYIGDAGFVEGGAEHYVAQYYSNNVSNLAYYEAAVIMTTLEYIIGSEKLAEIFFDSNTAYAFTTFLQENGFTAEDSVAYMNAINYAAYGDVGGSMKNPQEMLIKLYEIYKGTEFRNDLAFCEMLESCYLYGYSFSDLAPYGHAFTDKLDDWKIMVAEEFGCDEATFSYYPYPIIVDGQLKFSCLTYLYGPDIESRKSEAIFIFEYDFANEEIIDHEIIYKEWMPEDPVDRLPSELDGDGKELLAECVADNSAAHDQSVKGTNKELVDLYKRAEEIGSKHGVYIWFDDLVPEGHLSDYVSAASDPAKISDALDKIEAILDLYPEDYFDQLLFEYFYGAAICLYDGPNDDFIPEICYSSDQYYMVMNVNVSSTAVNKYYGAEETRAKYHPDLTPFEAQLLCEIWKSTERFFKTRNNNFEKTQINEKSWSKLNEFNFDYTGCTDDEIIDMMLSEFINLDYFTDKKCVSSATNDRVSIYMCMMGYALTGKKPEVSEFVAAKGDELCRAMRIMFVTDNWPTVTSWEKVCG